MPPTHLEADDLVALLDPEWLLAASDDDRDGVPDPAVLAAALEAAEADVDAVLAARYATPITAPLPAPLRQAALALAAEFLAARRPTLPLGDVLTLRIRQARALLDALARGTLALPGHAARPRADATTRATTPPLRAGAIDAF